MTNLLESRSIKENALKKTKKDLTLSYPQWSTIIHNHQVVQKTHTYIYKQIQHKKKSKMIGKQKIITKHIPRKIEQFKPLHVSNLLYVWPYVLYFHG